MLDEARLFVKSLPKPAATKVLRNVMRVINGERNKELFKKLDGSDGIWELRTKYDGMEYRLLAFWDKEANTLVIATHGIIKKTWRVPPKEIAKAERIRKQYFKDKTRIG